MIHYLGEIMTYGVIYDPIATVVVAAAAGALAYRLYRQNKEKINGKISGAVEFCRKYLKPERLSTESNSSTNCYGMRSL